MRVEPAHLCISLYSWHNWNILAGSGCYCNQAPQMHLGLFLFNSYISSLKLPGSRQFVECYQFLPGNICYHSPKITIPSQLKAELLFFCRLSYQVFWHFSVGSVDKELQKVARNTACFLIQPAACFHESLCWCREIIVWGLDHRERWDGLGWDPDWSGFVTDQLKHAAVLKVLSALLSVWKEEAFPWNSCAVLITDKTFVAQRRCQSLGKPWNTSLLGNACIAHRVQTGLSYKRLTLLLRL